MRVAGKLIGERGWGAVCATACVAALTWACSDEKGDGGGVACGEGTVLSGNQCVAATTGGSGGETGSGAGGTTGGISGASPSAGASGVPSSSGGTGGEDQGLGGSPGGGAPSGGAAGTGGSGGTTPVGEVGVLGEVCSPPATLACAGNFQKVGLICGASGTWEVNMTCTGDQFCDTTPGPNAGSCQTIDPECVDRMPGDRFCMDNEVYECGPDNLNTELISACTVVCLEGICRDDADPCPTDNLAINCARDCGGQSVLCEYDAQCSGVHTVSTYVDYDRRVVRMPYAEDACDCGSGGKVVDILASIWSSEAVMVTVSPPWFILGGSDDCGAGGGLSCRMFPGGMTTWSAAVRIVTADATAAPRNVYMQPASAAAACP